MNSYLHESVRLDLNNPLFQKQLFKLSKKDQLNVLRTLRKLSNLTWNQVYSNRGLKWELIYSRKGPHGKQVYSFRISKGFRGLAYREKSWMRILTLHPDHDSAY
ncbi:DUF3788 family protein [Candidatus Magnetomoraceae bacterium gMMP-15]